MQGCLTWPIKAVSSCIPTESAVGDRVKKHNADLEVAVIQEIAERAEQPWPTYGDEQSDAATAMVAAIVDATDPLIEQKGARQRGHRYLGGSSSLGPWQTATVK